MAAILAQNRLKSVGTMRLGIIYAVGLWKQIRYKDNVVKRYV